MQNAPILPLKHLKMPRPQPFHNLPGTLLGFDPLRPVPDLLPLFPLCPTLLPFSLATPEPPRQLPLQAPHKHRLRLQNRMVQRHRKQIPEADAAELEGREWQEAVATGIVQVVFGQVEQQQRLVLDPQVDAAEQEVHVDGVQAVQAASGCAGDRAEHRLERQALDLFGHTALQDDTASSPSHVDGCPPLDLVPLLALIRLVALPFKELPPSHSQMLQPVAMYPIHFQKHLNLHRKIPIIIGLQHHPTHRLVLPERETRHCGVTQLDAVNRRLEGHREAEVVQGQLQFAGRAQLTQEAADLALVEFDQQSPAAVAEPEFLA